MCNCYTSVAQSMEAVWCERVRHRVFRLPGITHHNTIMHAQQLTMCARSNRSTAYQVLSTQLNSHTSSSNIPKSTHYCSCQQTQHTSSPSPEAPATCWACCRPYAAAATRDPACAQQAMSAGNKEAQNVGNSSNKKSDTASQ